MIELLNLIEEEKETVIHYDHGCLMAKIKPPQWNELIEKIDPDDVYNNDKKEYGIETDEHVTLLYGFVLDHLNRNKLKSDIKQINPIKMTLTTVSMFDQPEYDVLKFDVKSSYLHKLNKFFRDNYKYESDFDEYKPHCTIAYLKKGKAKKYIELFNKDITQQSFKCKKLIFTGYSSDDQIIINLHMHN